VPGRVDSASFKEHVMKPQSCENTAAGGLSALLSRLAPTQAEAEPASGIRAVELNAEQVERVSGGRMALRAGRAGTTCSPCADDCGY